MYDLVISLGELCATAMALKSSKITEKSYPFDWATGVLWDKCGNCGLTGKIDLICNHFENAFCLDDFIEIPTAERRTKGVRNTKTGLQYIHDFPLNESIPDFFPKFVEKYHRRIKRLYDDIEHNQRILFVFVVRDNHYLPLEDIQSGYQKLATRFNTKDIHLLIMQSTDECQPDETIRTPLNNHITIVWYKDITGNEGNQPQIIKTICAECQCAYFSFCEKIHAIGLSDKEEFGRWSLGKNVLIHIETAFKNKNILAKFNVSPYFEENRNWQHITVFCNNRKLADWQFAKGQETNTTLKIPADINQTGSLNFEFLIKDPISPSEATNGVSNDRRKIALAFNSLIIHPE